MIWDKFCVNKFVGCVFFMIFCLFRKRFVPVQWIAKCYTKRQSAVMEDKSIRCDAKSAGFGLPRKVAWKVNRITKILRRRAENKNKSCRKAFCCFDAQITISLQVEIISNVFFYFITLFFYCMFWLMFVLHDYNLHLNFCFCNLHKTAIRIINIPFEKIYNWKSVSSFRVIVSLELQSDWQQKKLCLNFRIILFLLIFMCTYWFAA